MRFLDDDDYSPTNDNERRSSTEGALLAISASASILEIAERNRAGKIAAVMIVWAATYRADLQTYCSLAGLSR